MENEALLGMRHREDPFHPEDVGPFRLDQPSNPGLQQIEVQLTLVHSPQVPGKALVQAHARHAVVVLCAWSLAVEQVCSEEKNGKESAGGSWTHAKP